MKAIDFAFGGSTLEMLATKETSSPYVATLVPGTKCILVVKCKEYVKNLADIGFQFERYVTGHDMSDTSSCKQVEHIHLNKVGDSTVLFRAEVDAIDSNGTPVEVKSSNPRYFGTRVMFQMISSGSSSLCHGEKYRGTLTGVSLRSLSQVARDALEYGNNVKELEQNILNGMDALKNQVKEDNKLYKISFSNGSLKAVETSDSEEYVVLPKADIVNDLIN